jgi:predicted dithiol-disulfide oxidoreductase (DUF899 family)
MPSRIEGLYRNIDPPALLEMCTSIRHNANSGKDLKRDYHCETTEGIQLPLATVFHRNGGETRHFWSTEMIFADSDPGQDPRHNGTFEHIWNIFDLTPEGRAASRHEQLNYDCCSAHEHSPGDGFAND